MIMLISTNCSSCFQASYFFFSNFVEYLCRTLCICHIWHYTWDNDYYNYYCVESVCWLLMSWCLLKHCHFDNFQCSQWLIKISSKWHFCLSVLGVRTSATIMLTTRNLYDLIIYQRTVTQCVCTQPHALMQSIFIVLLTLICHYRLIH